MLQRAYSGCKFRNCKDSTILGDVKPLRKGFQSWFWFSFTFWFWIWLSFSPTNWILDSSLDFLLPGRLQYCSGMVVKSATPSTLVHILGYFSARRIFEQLSTLLGNGGVNALKTTLLALPPTPSQLRSARRTIESVVTFFLLLLLPFFNFITGIYLVFLNGEMYLVVGVFLGD